MSQEMKQTFMITSDLASTVLVDDPWMVGEVTGTPAEEWKRVEGIRLPGSTHVWFFNAKQNLMAKVETDSGTWRTSVFENDTARMVGVTEVEWQG